MRICVDIGGTKVLVACLDASGNIVKQLRFETPRTYKKLIDTLARELNKYDTKNTTVIGAPGLVDRTRGRVIAFGNLPWKNVTLKEDLETKTSHKIYVENDANLAALGEYKALANPPHQALYITVSTGIGTGIITDGVIDPDHIDSEGGEMLIEFKNKLVTWEEVASGKSIVAHYNKRASELDDPQAWQEISHWLAIGVINLLSMLSPDIIIIGGGLVPIFKSIVISY